MDTHVPRRPTERETEQLVDYLLRNDDPEAFDAGTFQQDTQQEIQDAVANACIAVFDHYVTTSPGYAGKLLVVVFASSPTETHTYAWDGEYMQQA
ncbi:MAG: hypothetical protein ACXWQZ_23710 [Ktedonobacterales bacterium]